MGIQKFEDLIAWQRAQDLALAIYQQFSGSKDWGFHDQICRASVSISNNIAEGFDRKGNKEFCRFLYIARGSTSEVKSMLYLAKKLNYLDDNSVQILLQQTEEVSRIINGLAKSLENTPTNY